MSFISLLALGLLGIAATNRRKTHVGTRNVSKKTDVARSHNVEASQDESNHNIININLGTKAENSESGYSSDDGSCSGGSAPTVEIINDYWYINGENTGVKARGEDGRDGTDGEDGHDGATPQIINDYWHINGQNTGVRAIGRDGSDGTGGNGETQIILPEIINGYWYVNGQNTGQKAQGERGPRGYSGSDGSDGATPEIIDGYWYIEGKNTGVRAIGLDGSGKTVVPTINSQGYWVINGQNTGVKATGNKGDKGDRGPRGYAGADGQDGATPTINSQGYWVIDGRNTGIKAVGEDGEDGTNGATPEIINGYWYIDGTNTGVKAKGEKGDRGPRGARGPQGEPGVCEDCDDDPEPNDPEPNDPEPNDPEPFISDDEDISADMCTANPSFFPLRRGDNNIYVHRLNSYLHDQSPNSYDRHAGAYNYADLFQTFSNVTESLVGSSSVSREWYCNNVEGYFLLNQQIPDLTLSDNRQDNSYSTDDDLIEIRALVRWVIDGVLPTRPIDFPTPSGKRIKASPAGVVIHSPRVDGTAGNVKAWHSWDDYKRMVRDNQ